MSLFLTRRFLVHRCFRRSAARKKHLLHSQISEKRQEPIEPLRILFCGSDEFSATSLKALYDESLKRPTLIESVDVVCKQAKPVGRGMKSVHEAYIKKVAHELSLPVHEIPTFTGWSPPRPKDSSIDLIIAVSFGLRVPQRLLTAAKYGGLNLHPSLLPDLRGPAPLHHTLIQGRKTSGVTLQTLDPQSFDTGIILAQRSFDVPHNGESTLSDLLRVAALCGAGLLTSSLRNHVFVPPLEPIEPTLVPTFAPKCTSEDEHVDWTNWSAQRVLNTQRALAPLWSQYQAPGWMNSYRIQWDDLEMVTLELGTNQSRPMNWDDLKPHPASSLGTEHIGRLQTIFFEPDAMRRLVSGWCWTDEGNAHRSSQVLVGLWTCDGYFLQVKSVTVAGGKKHTNPVEAIMTLARVEKRKKVKE